MEMPKELELKINKYEEIYQTALKVMDCEVQELIADKKYMQGIFLFREKVSEIFAIYKSVKSLYLIINNNLYAHNLFSSEPYDIPSMNINIHTLQLDKDSWFSYLDESSDVTIEDLKELGYTTEHWYFEPHFLIQIEYLIKYVRMIVEPEFQSSCNVKTLIECYKDYDYQDEQCIQDSFKIISDYLVGY